MSRRGVVFLFLAFLTTFAYGQHPSLPSSFQAKTVHTPAARTFMCAGAEQGPWWFSFMGMLKTATRGHP